MRKTFYAILLFLCVVNLEAQVTYEHTFNSAPSFYGKQWKYVASQQPNVAYFRFTDTDNNRIITYSSTDFSIVESVNIILDEGYQFYSYVELPIGLYKNDNNEYYIITSINQNVGYDANNKYSVGIYKRTGNDIILDYEIISGNMYMYYVVCGNGEKWYVVIYGRSNQSSDIEYRIYSFNGSYTSSNQVESRNTSMMPYPNPCRDKIHLTFEAPTSASSIRISDVNGHVIDRIPVNTNESEYVLDVHTYPEGVYFYEINGKCQSFMIK